jgi:hypothetical protein
MRFLPVLLCFIVLCLPRDARAQVRQMADTTHKAPVNKTDTHGRRTGLWWIVTPARMGEPETTEYGNYDHGRKIGTWYKMGSEGDLVSAENYRNNVLDGEVKYYERGQLSIIGHYRGLNPNYEYDTVVVTDPTTGIERLVSIPTERGTLRHGIWRYYNPETGRLIAEEEYQVDDLIYKKETMLTREDSLYYRMREKKLPHNTGKLYKPPAGKDPYKYLND